MLEACRAIVGRACALPFVACPVIKSVRFRDAVEGAFATEMAPLAMDALVLKLAEALLSASGGPAPVKPRVDKVAVDRMRQFLDTETGRVVHSSELEIVSGLSRFDLSRQFRAQVGTSPYRYSLMRRLESARGRIGERPIVNLALEAGFADQAHFTRAFKAAFGIAPAKYAALSQSS